MSNEIFTVDAQHIQCRQDKRGSLYFIIGGVCLWSSEMLLGLGYSQDLIETIELNGFGALSDDLRIAYSKNKEGFRVGIEATRLSTLETIAIDSYTDTHGYSGVSTLQDAPY